MPLNIRSICASFLLVVTFSIFINAQTSADVMRERVAKAKAFIAVKNFNAAIYELENIRRETKDPTVNSVVNVLLMNSYLEQGDYKRAQDFLKELSSPQNKQSNPAAYFAVAGQVVKGARNQLERYKSLGLSVSDRSLPIEAAVDIDKMRETLELVIEQSKTLGKDKTKASDAMALLEEATNARSGLAKDDYDANRWKNEVADAREMLANSRSVIINAISPAPVETATVENSTTPINSATANKSVAANTNQKPAVDQKIAQTAPTSTPASTTAVKPASNSAADKSNSPPATDTSKSSTETAKTQKQTAAETPKEEIKKADENAQAIPTAATSAAGNRFAEDSVNKPNQNNTEKTDAPKDGSPLAIGSLIEYATKKTNPVYPLIARNMRMTGVVRVELVVNEDGEVAEVQKTSGPPVLQNAALDAIKKWKFKPFTRDGEPVKATGYVSFNFNL